MWDVKAACSYEGCGCGRVWACGRVWRRGGGAAGHHHQPPTVLDDVEKAGEQLGALEPGLRVFARQNLAARVFRHLAKFVQLEQDDKLEVEDAFDRARRKLVLGVGLESDL